MGILSFLRLAENVRLRRQVVFPIGLGNIRTHLLDHFIRNTGRIGTHVRDEPHVAMSWDLYAFIQVLRKHHRFLRAEIQLIDGILLHGGGGVGRLCLALLSGLRDSGDFRFFPLDPFDRSIRLFPIMELRILPVDLGQLRFEGLIFLRLVHGFDRPVLDRDKSTDLLFSFADKAGRDRLHAACGKTTVDLPPQPWRELVTHQTVEDTARLLGIDTVKIDRLRILDRFTDRRRRDLMESNTHLVFRIHIQKLRQMPGDRFAFAIRVRCQKDIAALVRRFLQILDDIRPIRRIDVLRRKAILYIDPHSTLGEITQVSHGRHDFVVRS